MKHTLMLLALLLSWSGQARAQAPEEGEEEDERVQYTLILPEEKTPDLVKPEENNPFQAITEEQENEVGGTEEVQVRDLLLRMSVTGGVSGPRGMRVMLGGMRLETGMEVPPVIPDQQVKLKVKSITPSGVELVWLEDKPTGLPPKTLVIPMDGSPAVRYRMPSGLGGDSSGERAMGTVRRPSVSAFSPSRALPSPQPSRPATRPAPEREQASVPERREQAPARSEPAPAPSSSDPDAPAAPAASVIRMLFGSHPPASK